MDGDFKTPSDEPDASPTTTVDTPGIDSPKTDEPTVPDMKDSPASTDNQPPAIEDPFASSENPAISDETASPKANETTDSTPLVIAPSVMQPVKIHGAHKYIYGYLGLVILVAAVVGVYVWQHNKVSSLNTQVATINSELSSSQNEVTSLKSQLAKANAAEKSAPAILGISVVKATRYTPSATNSAANSGVAVDVSITNSTTKAVSLVTSDFKLKDAQSNSYGATNFPSQSTDPGLPSGYTLLSDQSLAPSATVSGTLEFSVPTTSLTGFTLVYNSQTVAVSVITVTSN